MAFLLELRSMTEQKKSSKFGLGIIVGLISGAVAGVFLAPKTGKKMRADLTKKAKQIRNMLKDADPEIIISDIFDEVTEKSTSVYNEVKDMLSEKLADLAESAQAIDKGKYLQVVRAIIDELRGRQKMTEEQLDKVKKHLEEDFGKLQPIKKQTKTKKTKAKKS